MQHLFDVDVAKQYSVDMAIFLKNLAYWVMHNKANNIHFYDGSYWTFNSMKAFSEIFSYWSERQIDRIVKKCIKEGLVRSGSFNHVQYDRTLWYTLTEKGAKLLNITILPNGEMDFTKRLNGLHQTVRPIPNIKHNNKLKDYRSSGDEQETGFNEFWKAYPRKQNRKRAERMWERNECEKHKAEIMAHVAERLKTEWSGKDTQFVPLADTFLNNDRWKDEILLPREEKKPVTSVPPRQNETHSTVQWFKKEHEMTPKTQGSVNNGQNNVDYRRNQQGSSCVRQVEENTSPKRALDYLL